MISTVTYNGDGATRIFPVAFEIKGEEYTVVYVGGVAVADRSLYDIINNSIVFNTAPVIGTNNVEIVVASTTTEIADLNAPPSTIQTVLDNMVDINAIANTVIPNIDEILLADDNATTATTKALEALTSANNADTSEANALTYSNNALTSANNADASEAQALSYKNSAEASATTATTQAGIATTKAGEASTSASNALASEVQAGLYAGMIAISLGTIENMTAISLPQEGQVVVVRDANRGGVFIYRSTGVTNGGTIFDSSSTGKWCRQYSGAVNVKWFGAIGNGITDDSSSIQGASQNNEIYFPLGTYKINTSISINNKITFLQGANLLINMGVVVTLFNTINASPNDILFSGQGVVTPAYAYTQEKVYARWFGVDNKVSTSSSSVYLQNAINFVQDMSCNAVLLLPKNGSFSLSSAITIKQGKSTTDTKAYTFEMDGQNCSVLQNFNGTCFTVVPRCLLSNINTSGAIAQIKIKNINANGYYISLNNYTNSVFISIGDATHAIDSFDFSELSNILVIGYLKPPIHITNSRHFIFNNIVTRDQAGGINIAAYNSAFCGDFIFNNCEFQGKVANPPLELVTYNNSGAGTASIRGIKFNDCVIYGSGSKINCSTAGAIGDLWFNSIAFDVGSASEECLFIYTASGSSLFNVIFDNLYLVNFTNTAIEIVADTLNSTNSIQFNGGQISLITATSVIKCTNINDITITGMSFQGITATNIVESTSCTLIKINNCTSDNTVTNFIKSVSSNYLFTNNAYKGAINISGGYGSSVNNLLLV